MKEIESNIPLLILILPLVGFLLNGIVLPLVSGGISKTSSVVSGIIATLSIGAAFVCAVFGFSQMLGDLAPQSLLSSVFTWLKLGDLNIPFHLRMDHLSGLLVLIITGIGTLIHLYSVGYMSHEHGASRYFSYLNLFCFSMLLLVLGDNLALLFFGWEGVGLCSYLLIGYWYEDPAKASAGKKAFIANRIGDLGFLLGMFLIFYYFGTLTFSEIAAGLSAVAVDPGVLTLIALLFFVGATGKSAQIPLYVWLPDAMAGPTPVSALIHAATMVTAGVYLIARMNFIYDLSPMALSVVAHIGALTALFAGTIAIAQNDIKKVLAYSTVSQLGYMFLACGVGAYQTAVFHLMTHAFFKALLFLGSGSVIHACSGEQDMTKMGGLQKHLPITYWTMLIGSLAISGIPFFSGFFSKDEILYATLALPMGGVHLYILGMLTAFLTAVYTTRMMALTFWGKERLDHHAKEHLHESPLTMTLPLIVLAVLAALGGFLGFPHLASEAMGTHFPHAVSDWLSTVVPTRTFPHHGIHLGLHEFMAMGISAVLACLGMFLGARLFRDKQKLSEALPVFAPIQSLLENKYYVDEIYEVFVLKPISKIAGFFWRIIDVVIIDGFVLACARNIRGAGQKLRVIQSGDIQVFSLAMALGLAALAVYVVYFMAL